jgi:hypothetical protein
MKPVFRVLATLVIAASSLPAQDALLPSASWGGGLNLSAWYFTTPLVQSGGNLQAVTQVAVPFRIQALFGRFSVDLSGAGAAGAALFKASGEPGGEGEGGDGEEEMRVVSLFGPTDLKLRVTGPIVGDNLVATLGLNLPTGKVGMNSEETEAMQVLGAPALRMPVASFGTGAGVTLGAIRAFEFDSWALALGASVEQRTEYSPVALALSSGRSETKITPGMALHFTGAIDRTLGEHRLGVLLTADQFSRDQVMLDATTSSSYQLGPQLGVAARLAIGSTRWRSSEMTLSYRLRGEFSDAQNDKVSGSSGTYIEGSIGGVRGSEGRTGLILGADFRLHSGLTFTDQLVGAATTAGGVSIGFESPRERSVFRMVLRGQYGTFDTGVAKGTGMGVSLGFAVAARREAQ